MSDLLILILNCFYKLLSKSIEFLKLILMIKRYLYNIY